jgi:hypothetical protein
MAVIKIFKNFINLLTTFLKFILNNFFLAKNINKISAPKVKNFNSLMLIYANVMHVRTMPKINKFFYKVFYICFDISKINKLSCKFFSVNRFNIFSFYEKDHGKRDGSSIEIWIRKLLYEKNLDDYVKKIFLFTHPRCLGYVFNPVSFWFCIDDENNLRAILFEVNNTFAQSHSYLVYNEDKSIINPNQWFECNKNFYVSPFFEITGKYKFRVNFVVDKIAVWIDYVIEGKKNLLTNVISYKVKPFTESSLLSAFLQIPFLTFKVIFLIHWQALKLFFKRNKYVANPNKIPKNITTNNDLISK